MRIVGMHHVALYTERFELLRAFYVERLGLPVVGGLDDGEILFLEAGGTTIELTAVAGVQGGRGGWRHLAWEVEDVDAAYRELTALGVPFHVPPEDYPADAPKLRIAFFRDPDRNEVELVQPLGARYPAFTERAVVARDVVKSEARGITAAAGT